ncbi:U1 small nuclear ribonucleoprotein 70 kDa like protein [Tritrichomonas foetus]|uniref:U1 small nuclear ribonucleoprotein 70 kDa like protein n=1 Tax=Tritrichomonas foetus TaxID=1144522 RepID=A0A1J4JU73_9EUKA|nr:U1 small nuclear ribonucleoprotein 70 kDa like protein [Tritrichomonas foetus]|eukprot:OHT02024.1 U1 small nuclear ribonucleoprotein 70 kDa like protein [Tritrichomonas foetus]
MPPKYSEDIVSLFKARPRMRFIEPIPRPPPVKFTGVSKLFPLLEQIELPETGEPKLPINEARILRRNKRIEANNQKIAEQKSRYNPKENPNATSNPFNTLFIGGIPDYVTEKDIRYELGCFGPIRSVKFVYDKITGKRKNYCFAEYEREDSFKNAMTQGTKLYFNNRKMIVDCERARTVENWLPRRLGGGIGGLSRRFLKKMMVMRMEICKKRKKVGYKCGIKYRGTLAEVSKRRDEKIGLDRYRQALHRRGRGGLPRGCR